MTVGPTGAVLRPPRAQPVPGKNKGCPEEEAASNGWRPGSWWQLWPWHFRQPLGVPGPLFSHMTLGRGKERLKQGHGDAGLLGSEGATHKAHGSVSATQPLQEEKAGTLTLTPV